MRWPRLGVRSGAVFAVLVILVILTSSIALSAQAWTLQWSDEFNGAAGAAPDPAVWGYDTGGGGFGNGEVEVYCAPGSAVSPCAAGRPNLFTDGKGHLVIHAVRAEGVWTSGRMKTEGKKSFRYGRIEARMKWQIADGFWPAFWMLGSDIGSVGWPRSGEQDVMEWVQKYGPGKTSSTVHGPGYSGGKGIGGTFAFPDGGRVDDAFHTYGVVWTENKLSFYRDNPAKPYLTMTPASLPAGAEWVYNRPLFLLLNFAIGGLTSGFSGSTDGSTPSSGVALVDYVRVWRSAGVAAGRWYSVQSKASGRCVDGAGQSACAPGSVGQVWQFGEAEGGYFKIAGRGAAGSSGFGGAEEWRAVALGDGSFRFVSRGGKCLEVAGAGLGTGVCDGGEGQAFVLTEQP